MKKIISMLAIAMMIFTVNSCASDEEERQPERGGRQQMQGGPQGDQQGPDIAAAAETLGVTEQALMDALGDPRQMGPDTMKNAAETLGVTEQELMDAMGPPPGGAPSTTN